MREVKFRAWDYSSKKMREVESIQLWPNFRVAFVPHTKHKDLPTIHQDKQWFELMEWTGLKDKAGREIYEGDILEKADASYGRDRKVVEWRATRAGCGFNIAHDAHQIWLVIGNTHENPGFLERSSDDN